MSEVLESCGESVPFFQPKFRATQCNGTIELLLRPVLTLNRPAAYLVGQPSPWASIVRVTLLTTDSAGGTDPPDSPFYNFQNEHIFLFNPVAQFTKI